MSGRNVRKTPDTVLSEDNTVRVWDVSSGREVARLEGHGGGVMSVAWSADSTRIASGGDDNTVRVWGVQTVSAISRTFQEILRAGGGDACGRLAHARTGDASLPPAFEGDEIVMGRLLDQQNEAIVLERENVY